MMLVVLTVMVMVTPVVTMTWSLHRDHCDGHTPVVTGMVVVVLILVVLTVMVMVTPVVTGMVVVMLVVLTVMVMVTNINTTTTIPVTGMVE